MTTSEALALGRAAFHQRRWREALDHLLRADRAGVLEAEDLMLLGSAAHLVGAIDLHLRALERAHRVLEGEGRALQAARCAFLLGFSLAERGEVGQGAGWVARAQRIVEAHGEDCVERGWLLIPDIQRALSSGDNDTALSLAERAATLAERFDDADLGAFMLHARGLALVRQGRVSDGLALFDEAIVVLTRGDLTPRITGTLYCSVISACLQTFAVERADEWTSALDAWCADQPDLVPYAGACRVYRAEVLQLRGAWEASLTEAREAERRCGGGVDPRGVGAALYRQAEVHRVRGELDAAEEGYRGAARAGVDALPGLAWLRIAQEDAPAAVGALRRGLSEARDAGRRARLLPALVDASLAVGAMAAARAAADELASLAVRLQAGVLAAAAAHARGDVARAAGDAEEALRAYRAASEGWRSLEAPYEVARAREGIGLACAAVGDLDGAALELDIALEVYERLGATPDAERARRHRQGLVPGGTGAEDDPPLTDREREVLRLVADGDSNKSIAAALGISERTVERHVSNIFDKLGVRSRAAATAFAIRHGLV